MGLEFQDFDKIVSIRVCTLFRVKFWLKRHQVESKLQNFDIVVLKNEYVTLNLLLLLTLIFLLSITICNLSVLKHVLAICTNCHNDLLKTWSDIRKLVFILNKDIYRKFPAVLKVYQR